MAASQSAPGVAAAAPQVQLKAGGTYRRLLPYLREHWRILAVGTALALVVSAAEGMIAWLVEPAVDRIFGPRDLLLPQLLPLALLAVYLVKGAARFGQSYLMASVGERVVAGIRRQVYAHIQKTGSSIGAPVPLDDFKAFSKLMGFEHVWDFEKKWAGLG